MIYNLHILFHLIQDSNLAKDLFQNENLNDLFEKSENCRLTETHVRLNPCSKNPFCKQHASLLHIIILLI